MLSSDLLPYDEIIYFMLTAKLLSFTKTGNILNTSNVHVMRKINNFEKRFKYKLFERSNKQLRLNQHSVSLYKMLYFSLDKHHEIITSLNNPPLSIKQNIRICIPSLFYKALLPFVSKLINQCPNISITLHTHSFQPIDNINSYDFALVLQDHPLPKITWLETRKIIDIPQVFCATTATATLLKNPFILPTYCESVLDDLAQKIQITHRLDDPTCILSFLLMQHNLASDMSSILPSYLVETYITDKSLYLLEEKPDKLKLKLLMVENSSSQSNKLVDKVHAFIESLLHQAQ